MNDEKKAALISELKSLEPVSFEDAQKIAKRENVDIRAITALTVKNGITYIRKGRTDKAGRPVVNKGALIQAIESKLGEPMPSLDKLNKSELSLLLDCLA